MATLNVPGSFASVADAVAAARPGDTIAIAPGYAANETVSVTVDRLTFDAPSNVTGILLRGGDSVSSITLRGNADIDVVGLSASIHVLGNDGDNRIEGSFESDTIDGGAGNDLIHSGGGRDVLRGGAGDDTFRLPFFFTNLAGSIDGGTGSDTVVADTLGSFTFKDVETLDTASVAATLAQLSSFQRIVDNSSAKARIAVELVGKGGRFDASTQIAGRDAVAIDADALMSGLRFKGTANADHITGTKYNDTLDGGAGNDSFDVSGPTIYSRGGTDKLRGGAGNDTFNLYGVGRGSVDGGSGKDTVKSNDLDGYTFRNVEVLDTTSVYGTIAQLNAFDRIVADEVKGAFQIDVNIRGKGGRIDFSNLLTGADSVRLSEGGLSSGLKAKGTKNADALYGSRFSDTLDGGAGNDTFYGSYMQTKADILKGGSGNDVFHLRSGGRGSVDGGSGIDTVNVWNLEGLTFRNIEKVDTTSLSGTAAQISALDHITDSSAAQTSFDMYLQGKGGTVDFSHRLDGRDSVFVWGTEAKAGIKAIGTSNQDGLFGSKYADTLMGGNGDDSLQGENGNDVLVGGAGKDFLYGGGFGADKMTGGAGADTFAFTGIDERGGIDQVTDFAVAQDKLRLNQGSLPAESGHLAGTAFKDLGVAGATVDADDRIVYDHRTGALSYDPDGSGAKAAVQFAVIDNHALLTAHDFIV